MAARGAGDETVFKVPIDGAPMHGNMAAPVTIVEFSDFECPFCSRVLPTIDKLMKAYPDKIRIFFKNNPLPFHADAPLAAQAGVAADMQGKFWAMHDMLFANQSALGEADLLRYAKALGLDVARFDRDRHDPKVAALVDAFVAGNMEEARNWHLKLLKISNAMFIETNPVPVKTALGLMGKCSDEVRLPLAPMSEANKAKLAGIMKEYKLI